MSEKKKLEYLIYLEMRMFQWGGKISIVETRSEEWELLTEWNKSGFITLKQGDNTQIESLSDEAYKMVYDARKAIAIESNFCNK